MKKLTYISLLVAGTMISSCDLDAPAKSSMGEDVIFSTEQLADAAVMGIHQSFGETNSYRGRFIPYFGTNTDCEMYNNYAGVADPTTDKEASLACYSAQVNNTYMNTANNAWAKLYEGIERANNAISSIEQYGDIENKSHMAQLYGELLTLRGLIYYDLVKAWGDVPYRFDPITSETMYLPKSDRTTVLKKVIEDLLVAEKYLGWPNENKYTQSTERVSKSFAKGLRARAALFLAGYSEWPNEGLRYNITDEAERKEMYRIALQECTEIINQGCNQLGTFDENFRDLCKESTTAGKESIYELPFSDGRGRVLYAWGGKHKSADAWTALNKGGVNGPTPTLWYDFDPSDYRRNITCLPYVWNEGKKATDGASGGGWSFGKLRFEWMTRRVTSTNDDGINYQVMRYADIYMMAAEAENALNGPSNAAQYLKPILDRAYPADKVNNILSAASTNAATFQQTIMDQRKFEFAGEGLRKIDLMRWGKLSSALADTKAKMSRLAKREGEYAAYPKKIYYNEGLGAESTDADGYTIYGLEAGETDEVGKANYDQNSFWFTYRDENETTDSKELQKLQENNAKIDKYLQYLYINDPNSRMFWPIWKVFIDSSNGMLTNDYNY